MSDLELLKRGKSRVKIIEEASSKWMFIASRLSDDPNKATSLSLGFKGDPEKCLRQLFVDCFINKKPANNYTQDWDGIVELLVDVELQHVAEKVKNMTAHSMTL